MTCEKMEKESHSPPKPSNYLPVRQLSNRGRSLSPDRYFRQQVPPPIAETTIGPGSKHIHSLSRTDNALAELEHKPTNRRWSHLALTRRNTMDSILLPPPVRSSLNTVSSQAELSGQSCHQLPSSCSTSPKVQSTCDAPNRHQSYSASDKTRPALPRMRLVKALTIDITTLEHSSCAKSKDLALNNESISQSENDPVSQMCATSKGTHSDSIQTTETDTSTPSVKYDPDSAVDEELLPLLALIVGEKLFSLTESLGLDANIHKQAKETYSLPDTQALYVLRVWVDQKERVMSELLDALDRTGLKEAVVWAKAGRLKEFLHMKQKRKEHQQAKWVSRFSTSVKKPASSTSLVKECGVDIVGMRSRESGVSLSQQALLQHNIAMKSATSNDITIIDGQPIRSGYMPLLATSPSMAGTFSDMDTDEGHH